MPLKEITTEMQVGESYTAEDCSSSCTCESAGADLTCKDMSCTDNFVCGTDNGEPACVCEAPFVLNGGECMGKYVISFTVPMQ